jgi:hypothetical protein
VSLRALRHDWPVRWAHHPLCARHAHETWRLGRLHLCRGCVSLFAGAGSAAIALPSVPGSWPAWALGALLPLVLVLSWPAWYRALPRALRDALRFGAGASLLLSLWATWQFPREAWPLLPLLWIVWRVYSRARAQLAVQRCEGCPELGRRGVCSGFALQAACARALEADLEARLGASLSGEGPPALRLRPRR